MDPVGLDTRTPSQPNADTGLPSMATTTPSTPWWPPFSKLASLSAQPL